jgi:hypothetical protein
MNANRRQAQTASPSIRVHWRPFAVPIWLRLRRAALTPMPALGFLHEHIEGLPRLLGSKHPVRTGPRNHASNSLAATSGISLASRPAYRQKFKNLSRCTLHQYSVFSSGRRPYPSAIRRTQGLRWVGCPFTAIPSGDRFPSLGCGISLSGCIGQWCAMTELSAAYFSSCHDIWKSLRLNIVRPLPLFRCVSELLY